MGVVDFMLLHYIVSTLVELQGTRPQNDIGNYFCLYVIMESLREAGSKEGR